MVYRYPTIQLASALQMVPFLCPVQEDFVLEGEAPLSSGEK